MPVQTRAKAPANRIYSSPAAQQQVKFQPRKRLVVSSRSLGEPRRTRQQTLTQLDFVDFQETTDHGAEDRENGIYVEEEHVRKRKRRRTERDAPSSTSNFHTQTLTQLEFVSTPAPGLECHGEIGNDVHYVPSNIKPEKSISDICSMGPPKTPSRRRVYEVPSSQSPLSPASIRSQRSLSTRSPLGVVDANRQIKQLLSPLRMKEVERSSSIKVEIQDTFENESQQSRIPQTPKFNSNPKKSPNPTVKPLSTIGTYNCSKDEIQDSDAEDEDLEIYYNGPGEESQQEHFILESSAQVDNASFNLISSDTQEAEEQLQSTILQFTQRIPSTAEGEEQCHTRPSQATTVSLSQTQPPTSSPTFPRRPHPKTPAQAVPLEDDEALLTIPDSPSHQLASDLSLSPILPHLPLERQPETTARRCTSIKDIQKEADIPLVPFSLASSQILTRSQMLPESLMNESVPAPPSLVEDSDND